MGQDRGGLGAEEGARVWRWQAQAVSICYLPICIYCLGGTIGPTSSSIQTDQ